MQGSGDAAFGKSVRVIEPPIGATRRVGFASLDMGDVGYLNPGKYPPQDANDFPRARDWTIYASALVTEVPGVPGIIGPLVDLEVAYGTGGSDQTIRQTLPVTGACVHVVAQYVRVSAVVRNQIQPDPRELEIAVSVAPGTSTRTIIRQSEFTTAPAPLEVIVPIPPFAIDVSGVGKAGGLAFDALLGEFGWQGEPGGLVFPLATFPLADVANPIIAPGGYCSIPPDANVVTLRRELGGEIQNFRLAWGVCA